MTEDIIIERHPWPPFMPEGAKVLILGTFPPGNHRWSMDFYYPNPQNDFWRIMGLLLLGDKDALYNRESKRFDREKIEKLMSDNNIALNDTAREVRRLKGNASDKFLEIVTPVPLYELLAQMPQCHTVATTGEKAAGVVSELTATPLPRMGEMVVADDGLNVWRMPSSSRAYPMKLEVKASYYSKLLRSVGIIH